MTVCLKKFRRRRALCSSIISVILLPSVLYSQRIDLNANGISDIWEQIYGVEGIDPNLDSDGDGLPNRLEAIAGTHPLDKTSIPKIALGAYMGDHFTVSIPSQL